MLFFFGKKTNQLPHETGFFPTESGVFFDPSLALILHQQAFGNIAADLPGPRISSSRFGSPFTRKEEKQPVNFKRYKPPGKLTAEKPKDWWFVDVPPFSRDYFEVPC